MKIKLMNNENFNDVLEQHRWHHGCQLTLYILLFSNVIRKRESLFVDIQTEDEILQMYILTFYEDVPHKLCTSPLLMEMCLIYYAHS